MNKAPSAARNKIGEAVRAQKRTHINQPIHILNKAVTYRAHIYAGLDQMIGNKKNWFMIKKTAFLYICFLGLFGYKYETLASNIFRELLYKNIVIRSTAHYQKKKLTGTGRPLAMHLAI